MENMKYLNVPIDGSVKIQNCSGVVYMIRKTKYWDSKRKAIYQTTRFEQRSRGFCRCKQCEDTKDDIVQYLAEDTDRFDPSSYEQGLYSVWFTGDPEFPKLNVKPYKPKKE